MSQSPAAHFCNGNATGCDHGSQCQGRLIPDAARGMLVHFYPLYAGQIQALAAFFHGKGKSKGFLLRHAPKVNCHHHGGHLVIRDGSVRIPVYHFVNLFFRKCQSVPFLYD